MLAVENVEKGEGGRVGDVENVGGGVPSTLSALLILYTVSCRPRQEADCTRRREEIYPAEHPADTPRM